MKLRCPWHIPMVAIGTPASAWCLLRVADQGRHKTCRLQIQVVIPISLQTGNDLSRIRPAHISRFAVTQLAVVHEHRKIISTAVPDTPIVFSNRARHGRRTGWLSCFHVFILRIALRQNAGMSRSQDVGVARAKKNPTVRIWTVGCGLRFRRPRSEKTPFLRQQTWPRMF